MRGHIAILGWLHIALHAFTLLGAFLLLLLMVGIGGFAASAGGKDALPALPIMGAVGGFLFLLLGAVSLPGLVAGIGLLRLAPWARILAIVISVFDLLHFPFGTAIGIYGLVILLSPEAAALFP